MIVFEHPFNERTRTYLRLESLFVRLFELMSRNSVEDHHFALTTLFEILDIAGRPELKTEVLKDLDKQKNVVMAYRGNPAIDEQVLTEWVAQLDSAFSALSLTAGRVGQSLLENDWLMSVRSRVSIPGGTCSFDLPGYFAWQNSEDLTRKQNLLTWVDTVRPVYIAISLLLRMIRDSGAPQKMIAPMGVFQQTLPPGKTFNLVRLGLSKSAQCVPEITVNRLMTAVRFVRVDLGERSRPVGSDVTFELSLC